jgi:hypothetical protein
MTALLSQPKPVRERNDAYGDFIRTQPCLIRDQHKCRGAIEAHHVIFEGQGRMGSKVSDYQQVPLCQDAHELARRRDWFQMHFGVDFEVTIARLNLQYSKISAGRRKQSNRTVSINPTVTDLGIKCSCGVRHKFSPSKLTFKTIPGGNPSVSYWCPRKRETLEAKMRRAA